jgi:hypothetical protein
MVLLGTPMNRLVDPGDALWGIPMPNLPRALQLFLIGEVKIAFLSYSVLLFSLREELITDMDAWGYLLGTTQSRIATWFAEWTAAVLRGVFVDQTVFAAANNRQEALAALRARAPDGNLLPHPPYRVRLVMLALEGAVTITKGGARFLHIERERTISRFQIFGSEIFPHYPDLLFEEEFDDQKLMYVRLGQHNLQRLDSLRPVPQGNDDRLLVFHPRLPLNPLRINPDNITERSMIADFNRLGRASHEALFAGWVHSSVPA